MGHTLCSTMRTQSAQYAFFEIFFVHHVVLHQHQPTCTSNQRVSKCCSFLFFFLMCMQQPHIGAARTYSHQHATRDHRMVEDSCAFTHIHTHTSSKGYGVLGLCYF